MTEAKGITKIAVSGFKSLRERSEIEVRPLTILAGANSSGKSSIMQPLLLMKQTLEAPYDPGALSLLGANVKFTNADQFLARFLHHPMDKFEVQLGIDQRLLSNTYKKTSNDQAISVDKTVYENGPFQTVLRPDMPHDEIAKEFEKQEEIRKLFEKAFLNLEWRVVQQRCLLTIELYDELGRSNLNFTFALIKNWHREFEEKISEVIHVPALRGTPDRLYLFTPIVGPKFEGKFDNYTASIISDWQKKYDKRLDTLNRYLGNDLLKLTSNAITKRLSDAQIELYVGRTLQSGLDDLVSIADVGFGVSQVLPVLVALLAAEPAQLVYIEQPELHLYPRAQHRLAQVLADAANRGVRVMIETHSDLLLLGVQTLVAEGKLDKDKVILHWFERGEDGASKITSREMDDEGAFGDWPEDFADVDFGADRAYLDAVAARRQKVAP